MNTLPLFTNQPEPVRPAPSPIAVRRKRIKEAFANADAEWRKRYRSYILQFLASGPATAEDVRLSYRQSGLPQTVGSQRASGAIFIALKREGLIREVGKRRSRIYGNDISLYEAIK